MKYIPKEIGKLYSESKSYINDLVILTGGSAVAFALGFIFTPIITRLYLPEDYGKMSIINNIIAWLFSIASFSYNSALIIPNNRTDFHRLCNLIILLNFGIIFLFILVIAIEGEWFWSSFDLENRLIYNLFIVLIFVFWLFFMLAENNNIREKKFKTNAGSQIISVVMTKGSVVIFGYFQGSSVVGLLLGEMIHKTSGAIMMLRKGWKNFVTGIIKSFDIKEIVVIAKKYRDYPLFVFPSFFLKQSSVYLPVFVIGAIFNSKLLGFYSLAVSLVGIPIQVIGFPMGKVFLQKSNELVQKSGLESLRKPLIKFYYGVLFISCICYGLIFGFGDVIFKIFAGEDWIKSGEIAQILSLGLVFQIIAVAVGPTFIVLEKQKKQLAADLIGSISLLAFFFCSFFLDLTFVHFLYIFTILFIIKNFIFIYVAMNLVLKNTLKHIFIGIGIFLVVFTLFYLLHRFFIGDNG